MSTPGPDTIWVDESARESVDGIVYVIAGVRLSNPTASLDRLRGLLLSGQRYLHWRDESSVRRREIVGVLNELTLDVYIAVSHGVRRRRQETARQRCLASVVSESSVDRGRLAAVVVEGRGPMLNRADENTVLNEARVSLPGAPPTVSFAAKTDSPMLWIADAMASMASAHFAELGGSDHWWRSTQAARLTIRRVEV